MFRPSGVQLRHRVGQRMEDLLAFPQFDFVLLALGDVPEDAEKSGNGAVHLDGLDDTLRSINDVSLLQVQALAGLHNGLVIREVVIREFRGEERIVILADHFVRCDPEVIGKNLIAENKISFPIFQEDLLRQGIQQVSKPRLAGL
jgi:hypothetical protein